MGEKRMSSPSCIACHLCGELVPLGLRGTTLPLAPELDHVVPLSRGGAHAKENVRLAHRKCNNLKGDRPVTSWQSSDLSPLGQASSTPYGSTIPDFAPKVRAAQV
jgi:hypothetical protein